MVFPPDGQNEPGVSRGRRGKKALDLLGEPAVMSVLTLIAGALEIANNRYALTRLDDDEE